MSEQAAGQTSEETQDPGTAPDPVQNVKAEFQRKYGNLEAEVQSLKQANQALMERLTPKAKASQSEASDDIGEDEIYTDPKGFANKLVNKVSTVIESRLETRTRAETERQQTLMALAGEYPELQQQGSDMYTETLKALQGLPQDAQQSPLGYRTAVYQAAATLGLQPKSKRSKSDMKDDFSFAGQKGGSTKKKRDPENEVDDKVMDWAKLLGVPHTKDEDIEDLKKLSKRDWRKPE